MPALMIKEEFSNSWLDAFLIKSKSETFKGWYGFVSTFELLRQYSKCSKVQCSSLKYSPINLLGDSWNYMPPILDPSSVKHISRRILVIAKLSGKKDCILRNFL